jgi:hypothetical protein
VRVLSQAAAVKQAKEAKTQAKAQREQLSPRSLQLRAAKDKIEAQQHTEMLKVWKEDEDTGRRWTATKWLAARHVSAVVADALKLPPPSTDAGSQFAYVTSRTLSTPPPPPPSTHPLDRLPGDPPPCRHLHAVSFSLSHSIFGRYVKNLTREQVSELLHKANMVGLTDFIVESIETLNGQSTGSAEDLNDKFSTTAKFQMT